MHQCTKKYLQVLLLHEDVVGEEEDVGVNEKGEELPIGKEGMKFEIIQL